MFRWIGIFTGLICSAFSFVVAYLALRNGDGAVWLFSAFGLFFALGFLAFLFPVLAERSPRFQKIAAFLSGEPRPVTFVPHRFILAALITGGFFILAAILVPLLWP